MGEETRLQRKQRKWIVAGAAAGGGKRRKKRKGSKKKVKIERKDKKNVENQENYNK